MVQLQQKGYIGVFELVEDGKGGKFKVEVTDINECQPVKPNFSVEKVLNATKIIVFRA
ncbi:hypothetical protein HRED_06932 [Candidatus Haloredivivus sp. G17]|nr:hypothetical protein HRED_06932 [Candidatus Haloredivivus sp. G17]